MGNCLKILETDEASDEARLKEAAEAKRLKAEERQKEEELRLKAEERQKEEELRLKAEERQKEKELRLKAAEAVFFKDQIPIKLDKKKIDFSFPLWTDDVISVNKTKDKVAEPIEKKEFTYDYDSVKKYVKITLNIDDANYYNYGYQVIIITKDNLKITSQTHSPKKSLFDLPD
jgi:hypothetical protein